MKSYELHRGNMINTCVCLYIRYQRHKLGLSEMAKGKRLKILKHLKRQPEHPAEIRLKCHMAVYILL